MPEIENIGKLVAAINPEKYYDFEGLSSNLKKFKELVKKDFWQAVKDAKPKSAEEHKIVYDSSSETLEPVYFWILDFMNKLGGVEKLIDNFSSSPGSGHFSELMGKATHMQEQSMKIMQTIGVMVKSVINIIYDLREFEIRLSHYKTADSEDKEKKEAGMLALKQIWMDNVDMKRGNGSINAMSQQMNFVTLRDSFMVANSLEKIDELDLNDRVKRILKPRFSEFIKWKELSGKELKKRYDIEKNWLKSQVDSLKLYTRWAKPYLKAATQLEQKDSDNPALVKAFNTVALELAIIGKSKVNFEQSIIDKKLPQGFSRIKLKRDYYSCVLIDFYFRGIPQKAGQHYVFGGRVEVTFKGYALNNDELKMLKQKMEESDLNEGLRLAENTTGEALETLKDDLEYFLKESEEKKEEKSSEDVNPFSALIGISEKKDKEKKKDDKKIQEIKKDDYYESVVREVAERDAMENCYNVFDVYKKAHGMQSLSPSPFY
ncbi:MAG: hypothetical protein ABIG37_02335 [Nanoarchaeota archaeon]